MYRTSHSEIVRDRTKVKSSLALAKMQGSMGNGILVMVGGLYIIYEIMGTQFEPRQTSFMLYDKSYVEIKRDAITVDSNPILELRTRVMCAQYMVCCLFKIVYLGNSNVLEYVGQ